jgi:hypothetical protein
MSNYGYILVLTKISMLLDVEVLLCLVCVLTVRDSDHAIVIVDAIVLIDK